MRVYVLKFGSQETVIYKASVPFVSKTSFFLQINISKEIILHEFLAKKETRLSAMYLLNILDTSLS